MDEYLREAMRARRWTIPQLAEACNVATGLAQKWVSENPRYRVRPSPASCAKIADALGMDPDYVLELAGHRKARGPRAGSADPEMDARLAALVAQIHAGWPAMGEPQREFAVRVTSAAFSVQALNKQPSNRRRAEPSNRPASIRGELEQVRASARDTDAHGGLSTVSHALLARFLPSFRRLAPAV